MPAATTDRPRRDSGPGNSTSHPCCPEWGTSGMGDVASGRSLCYAPPAMPRQSRLDAPETLHHVMVRGIERRALFRDDQDRADFVARLAALAEQGALTVYAWALLPNHAHLLVRTGIRPLPRSMRRLLTGYAGAFNRRHQRVGHLFQNRYKSIVVEEEPYLLELVRYLHLNPLRAGVVQSGTCNPGRCQLRQLGYPGGNEGDIKELRPDDL